MAPAPPLMDGSGCDATVEALLMPQRPIHGEKKFQENPREVESKP